jgi:Na+-driven multidrug efflux pump
MKIRDASGWTIFVFGVLAFVLGFIGLIRPEILLSILGFEVIERASRAAGDYTIIFMTTSSMASFNIGIYYVLAALNDVKIFYRWTVPFRTLTFIVFTSVVILGIAPQRFLGVAIWELVGALATGIALYAENKKSTSSESVSAPKKKKKK